MSQDKDITLYELQPIDKFNDDMEYYIRKRKFKNVSKDINDILQKIKHIKLEPLTVI